MSTKIPIETARLVLREFEVSDFAAVHEYGSDPEVTRFVTFGPNTEEDTKGFIRRTMAEREEEPRTRFDLAVVMKESDRVIGGCGLYVRSVENREAEVGYVFHKGFWGRGCATEAAQALVDFAFDELGMHRVFAWCDERNTASANVMKKIGMAYEGRKRESRFKNGEWWNVLLYAILEQEWRSTR